VHPLGKIPTRFSGFPSSRLRPSSHAGGFGIGSSEIRYALISRAKEIGPKKAEKFIFKSFSFKSSN
jgi:hypothetical protein